MRKLIAIVLALSMILSFNTGLAFGSSAPAGTKNAASATYTDVPSSHWASTVIKTLSDRDVLGGYADRSFRPDKMVTRAEFAKMIAVFMNLTITTATVSSFPDVSTDHWAFKYIETDKQNNLIGGYPDGTYNPNDNIKRSEVSRIIVAANDILNAKAKSAASISNASVGAAAAQYEPFSDIKGHWAESHIQRLRDVGVADAYPDGLFRPERLCSRAEAAKLLYLLLQQVLGTQITPPSSSGSSSSGGSSGGNTPPPPPTQQPCPSCPGDLDPDAIDTWTVGPYTEYEGYARLYVDSDIAEVNGIPGAYIDIPEGALDAFDDTITIGLSVDLETLPDGGDILEGTSDGDPVDQLSPVIKITKSTCCNFRLPIEVTIPYGLRLIRLSAMSYEAPDVPSVFYWQDDSINGSRYVATSVKLTDLGNNYRYVTFKTVHSGEFVALTIPGLADRMGGYSESSDTTLTVDTGFRPNPNGFNSDSFDFNKTSNGITSIGMANYAAWNYGFKPNPVNNLFTKTYSESTQRELISHAFLASSNMWNNYNFDGQDAFFVGYQLIQTMKITGMPQTLVRYWDGYNNGVFLVYSCTVEDTEETGKVFDFSYYDPRYNGDNGKIFSLSNSEGWSFYPYFGFIFEGISSSVEPSNYETLFYGANNVTGGAWPSTAATGFSKIEITSHTEDTIVFGDPGSDVVHIVGKVTGGVNNARYLVVNVNGEDWLESDVIELDENGNFNIDFYASGLLGLLDGANSIMFYASCNDCATINRCAVPYSGFKEITIQNNYEPVEDE